MTAGRGAFAPDGVRRSSVSVPPPTTLAYGMERVRVYAPSSSLIVTVTRF